MIIPVVGCVILTAGTVIMGIVRIVTAGARLVRAGDFSAKAAKIMSLAVIEIIDLFLVGTVAYVTAVGLYRLFISQTQIELPTRLKINTLKHLEDKIIGVVVAALAVAFLGQAAGSEEPAALLTYGGLIPSSVIRNSATGTGALSSVPESWDSLRGARMIFIWFSMKRTCRLQYHLRNGTGSPKMRCGRRSVNLAMLNKE